MLDERFGNGRRYVARNVKFKVLGQDGQNDIIFGDISSGLEKYRKSVILLLNNFRRYHARNRLVNSYDK